MKKLSFIMLCILAFQVKAQYNCKTKDISGEKITTCHYTNNKVSTISTRYNNNNLFDDGKVVGYNKAGNEIFNYTVSRKHGSRSVNLKYHANGGVSRMEYYSAPDAGIQWYRLIITYDTNGSETNRTELSHDMHTHIIHQPQDPVKFDPIIYKPVIKPEKPEHIVTPKPFKQEIIGCQEVPHTNILIVNTTNKKVKAHIIYRTGAKKETAVWIAPKDTFKIESLSMNFKKENHYNNYHIIPFMEKARKKKNYEVIQAEVNKISTTREDYIFYLVRR
jgi:hypothetical protein